MEYVIEDLKSYLSAQLHIAEHDGESATKVLTLKSYVEALTNLSESRTAMKSFLDEISDRWEDPSGWLEFGEATHDVIVAYKARSFE